MLKPRNSIENFFEELIQVNDPEISLVGNFQVEKKGVIENKNLILERKLVISPTELYELIKLFLLYESSVVRDFLIRKFST